MNESLNWSQESQKISDLEPFKLQFKSSNVKFKLLKSLIDSSKTLKGPYFSFSFDINSRVQPNQRQIVFEIIYKNRIFDFQMDLFIFILLQVRYFCIVRVRNSWEVWLESRIKNVLCWKGRFWVRKFSFKFQTFQREASKFFELFMFIFNDFKIWY